MSRIANKPFILNLVDGQKSFAVGDLIPLEDEGHWYAQAHSDELPEAAPAVEEATVVETKAQAKARAKAEAAAAEVVEAAPAVEEAK